MSEQLGHGNASETLNVVQPLNLSGNQVIGGASSTVGFYGSAGTVKATLAQTTTRTTTQLRAEITALQNELVAKGLIAVS